MIGRDEPDGLDIVTRGVILDAEEGADEIDGARYRERKSRLTLIFLVERLLRGEKNDLAGKEMDYISMQRRKITTPRSRL